MNQTMFRPQSKFLPAAGQSAVARTSVPWGFAEFFVISQTVLPALLYLPGTQPLRIPIRMAAYGISLVALVIWAASKRSASGQHPSRNWLLVAVAYLVLMIAHPTTNNLLVGMAQSMLYLAVLAPVFWAPGMVRNPAHLRRLLAILLVCNGINSIVGILQVYDPGRWLPKEFSGPSNIANDLSFAGADGKRVVRPPGLSDAPGAVCGPAVATGVLGLAFCAFPGLALWKRAGSLALSFAGLAAMYLSHVRSALVVFVISVLIYVVLSYLQKERKRATALLLLATSIIFGALTFAVFLGGDSVFDRVTSLFEEDPALTYNRSRGRMVEAAFRVLLFEYPTGAGLGRWGMMRLYFGDESNLDSKSIWAEVQWASWILDGGVILLTLYSIALILATLNEWKISRRHPDPSVRSMAALVLATNLGTIALLFSYTPFTAPIGVQYWFLAGAVSGIARLRKPRTQVPA